MANPVPAKTGPRTLADVASDHMRLARDRAAKRGMQCVVYFDFESQSVAMVVYGFDKVMPVELPGLYQMGDDEDLIADRIDEFLDKAQDHQRTVERLLGDDKTTSLITGDGCPLLSISHPIAPKCGTYTISKEHFEKFREEITKFVAVAKSRLR